jgi:hypothetical protein
MSKSWRGFIALAILAACTELGYGQPRPILSTFKRSTGPVLQDVGKSQPDSTSKTKSPDTTPTVDQMKWPRGSILVVVDEIKDVLAAVPKMILLSPEKYKELTDRIQALEAKLKVEKQYPHACKLSARLEGDAVALRAELIFATSEPNRTLVVGLQGANLVDEGSLDKHTPILDYGPDGYAVQVKDAGNHILILNLKAPLGLKRTAAGAAERGFDLGLPGAAVTTLALELPNTIKEVRWNEHLEKRPLSSNDRWNLALGKIKTLSLSWAEATVQPGAGSLLTADAKITVHVDDMQINTRAEIELGDLRGQSREWRLLLPPQAKVEVKSASISADVVPADRSGLIYLVRLKEPGTERLVISVQVQQPRAARQTRLAVGPFLLLGAYQQQGTLEIKSGGESQRGQRLVIHRHPRVYQRDVPANQRGPDTLAVFEYQAFPAPSEPPDLKELSHLAPLELEWKPEKGRLETQVEHVIKLAPAGDAWQADLITKIRVKTLSSGVGLLDMQLPRITPAVAGVVGAGLESPWSMPWLTWLLASQKFWPAQVPAEFGCHAEGGAIPELLAPDISRRARIVLNRLDGKEFTLVLSGRYLLPAFPWQAHLDLPRPLDTLDRGAKATVTIDDKFEMLIRQEDDTVPVPERQLQTLTWEQSPTGLDLTWGKYRPELSVGAITDITIHDRNAHFHHELHVASPDRSNARRRLTPAPVLFRLPRSVANLKVTPSQRLISFDPQKRLAWIQLQEKSEAAEAVVLSYDSSLPGFAATGTGQAGKRTTEPFIVPLLWPEQATRLTSKVRIWCDPGMIPSMVQDSLAVETWRDRGPEIVPEKKALPGLVLHAAGPTLSLNLQLSEGATTLPALVFDRGLIQFTLAEDGSQICRARFLVRQLNATHIDVRLPGPVLNLSVALNKELINNWSLLEGESQVVRIPVRPVLDSNSMVLEIGYRLPATMAEGEKPWQATLYPPHFRNEVFLGRVRWQVNLVPGQVALVSSKNVEVDYQWSWRNGLCTPEPAWSGEELERWLTGEKNPAPADSGTVIFWRASLSPVRIWHFSRQIWLGLCSGGLLLLGLGLFCCPISRFAFWSFIIFLALGVAALGVLWPSLLPPLAYGLQPGLVVLLLVLAVQWLLHERYRQQLVFMPGFTRLKSKSSLVRASSISRPKEPSTVDAPASGKSA